MKPNRLWALLTAVMLTLPAGLVALAAALDLTIDFAGFSGGFAPVPLPGQLDSDSWRVSGLSEGQLPFGGTAESGDFARGVSPGGVGTGGLYAFDSGGNLLLGVQPTGTDFTPGSLTLRLRNETGSALTSILVSYDIFYWNDQDRGSSLTLAYATDGENFTPLPAVDFASPTTADPAPAWQTAGRSTPISLTLPAGGLLFLRWTSDDAGGSGSRDEIGLDNIEVTGLTPTVVTLRRRALSARAGSSGAGWWAPAAVLTLASVFVLMRRRQAGRAAPPLPGRCAMIGPHDHASRGAQRTRSDF